ncbi:hypothetical protein GOP56_02995 [Brevibacillus sp. 7WMA2]|nr:hypothetical protein C0R09_10445 [Brevibacillus laterosporus]QIC04660.1 hypothetical protein GOP56_02995 [Brevibacillus sp. 7WMA2]AYK07916.1 hypothetical protein D8Z77_16910 [Brevibacillus laterosporus]MDF9414127.1 hypothetical protein [Brevibacillus laterosporus]PCN43477.1 hypothetical protein B9C88_14950 [Brevibacillus laterosporus]
MNQTKKVVSKVAAIALVSMGIAGCSSSESGPSLPEDRNCGSWDYDGDDDVYKCSDRSSSYHGSYYHAGSYYSNKNQLYESSSYKSYRNSSSFKSSSRSGFGSGSHSSGG